MSQRNTLPLSLISNANLQRLSANNTVTKHSRKAVPSIVTKYPSWTLYNMEVILFLSAVCHSTSLSVQWYVSRFLLGFTLIDVISYHKIYKHKNTFYFSWNPLNLNSTYTFPLAQTGMPIYKDFAGPTYLYSNKAWIIGRLRRES
jgi:hypothetical protein